MSLPAKVESHLTTDDMGDIKDLKRATKPYAVFMNNALGIDSTGEDEVKQHYLRGA